MLKTAHFTLGLVFLLISQAANALSFDAPPDCEADGVRYDLIGDYAGGITMAEGFVSSETPRWLIVAQCENNKQLRMMIRMNAGKSALEPDYADAPSLAADRVVDMIASAERYTLRDVAEGLSDLLVMYEIAPLSKDHCICAVERD